MEGSLELGSRGREVFLGELQSRVALLMRHIERPIGRHGARTPQKGGWTKVVGQVTICGDYLGL